MKTNDINNSQTLNVASTVYAQEALELCTRLAISKNLYKDSNYFDSNGRIWTCHPVPPRLQHERVEAKDDYHKLLIREREENGSPEYIRSRIDLLLESLLPIFEGKNPLNLHLDISSHYLSYISTSLNNI